MTLDELSLEEQEEYNIWFDEMLARVRLHPREGHHFNMINEGNALVIMEEKDAIL